MHDAMEALIASFVADLAGLIRRHALAVARAELGRIDDRGEPPLKGQTAAGRTGHAGPALEESDGARRPPKPQATDRDTPAESAKGSTSAGDVPNVARLVTFYGAEWRQGRRAGLGLEHLAAALGVATTELAGAADELVRRGWLVWRDGTRDYVATRRMPRA
jgi:hypothetical protein